MTTDMENEIKNLIDYIKNFNLNALIELSTKFNSDYDIYTKNKLAQGC